MSVKVQTVVSGKAELLYKLMRGKSQAITAGILLLARNKRTREIFFSDPDAVEAILKNGENKKSQTKQQLGADKDW